MQKTEEINDKNYENLSSTWLTWQKPILGFNLDLNDPKIRAWNIHKDKKCWSLTKEHQK